jgi:hypothetical protein
VSISDPQWNDFVNAHTGSTLDETSVYQSPERADSLPSEDWLGDSGFGFTDPPQVPATFRKPSKAPQKPSQRPSDETPHVVLRKGVSWRTVASSPLAIGTAVSVAPSAAVTALVNLIAASDSGVIAGSVTAALSLGSAGMAGYGLTKGFKPKVLAVIGGFSALTADLVMIGASGDLAIDFAGWLILSASTAGAWAYGSHKTSEKRAKNRKVHADTDHNRAKRDLAEAKSETEAMRQAMMAAQLAKATAPEYQPVFTGGPDEQRLRRAFWAGLGTELAYVVMETTLTGWKAVAGLPSGFSRSAARTGWDKVTSEMAVRGRFVLADGASSNELEIRYLDPSRMTDKPQLGWNPGDSWATVADTGESVGVPLGRRILFAGTSGAGKSWSARPMLAEASEAEDHRLIIVDLKTTEARNWGHRARIVTEPGQVEGLADELVEEGERRLKQIPRGQDVISISPERPRLTVFVDEGAELISNVDEEVMARFRTIARKLRAAEIILVWCSQKVTMSGNGRGIDPQIAAQMTHRLSMAVATASEARVVFGEDAQEKGWNAHELPMPGWALLRNIEEQTGPQRLRMRAMSAAHVVALPDRPIWYPDGDRWYSGDDQYQELMREVSCVASDPETTAWRMRESGASLREIAEVTGISKSSLGRLFRD